MLNCTAQFQYYQHRALFYITSTETSDKIRIDFDTKAKTITVQKNDVSIGGVNLS